MKDVNRCFFLDLEYCFPSASKKSEWKYHPAKLRIMTLRVGKGPIKVVDVWKESDIWDEVFDLLEQGYTLVSHNVIADVRPDLCDDRILPYLLKGQIWDTLYCIPTHSEVLTPTGWTSMIEYSQGTPIMISDSDGNLSYEVPERFFIKPEKEKVSRFTFDNKCIFDSTNEHRHLLRSRKTGKGYFKTTQELKELKAGTIVSAGSYNKGSISLEDRLAYLIGFILGDGHRQGNSTHWNITVKKPRKIEILDSFLEEDKFEKVIYDNGNVRYTLSKGLTRRADSYIQHLYTSEYKGCNRKVINWENILKLDKVSLELILKGLMDSDGCVYKKDESHGCFFTNTNNDIIQLTQTLCHLVGKIGNFSRLRPEQARSRALEAIRIRTKDCRYLQSKYISDGDYEEVGCFTVSTGAFVTRQHGNIFITGNCEKLIHGMTDPIGEWSKEGASVDEEFEEDENIDNEHKDFSKVFALDSLIYRHTGIVVKKLYQDARNYLKVDLPEAVLQYCKEDIKYMHRIYENQVKAIEELDLQDVVHLNHKLIATSYVIMKYGVAIDIEKLTTSRKDYKIKASELEGKLLQVLPKVPHSDTQLIDLYFKLYWRKGGLGGFTSKTKAIEAVKKNQNHMLVTAVRNWVDKNRETYTHAVNLSAPGQKLESFKRMGIPLPDTSEKTIKNYLMDNDSLVLESYLTWQKCNSLLKKVLEKVDYGMYLRRDNTVRSTFYFVNPLNGRSSASEMNVQQIPRELKAIFGKPPGMVKIDYDYAAVEFYKLLNDYPEQKLVQIMLSDNDDIHIYNAARFFEKNYDELLKLHKAKDKETKNLRNAAKTVIYFLQYKTPKKPEETFVTGTAKLMEIFRTDLGWDLSKEMAERLIIQGEEILHSWTKEKLLIDGDVLTMANGKNTLKSKLLKHLRTNSEDMRRALEDGIIFFRGAMNMYYKFDMGRDYIYAPEHQVWEEAEGRYKTKREYVNSRSLYSCAIAGPVAIGAKHAVMSIQQELFEKFGFENARLNLFVHDSVSIYCKPEIAEEVKEIVIRNLLHSMHEIAKFRTLPIKIEGNIEGQDDEIYSYDGVEIVKL